MALRRCTRSVDGTIPIRALLYDDEELLASQDGVGIYDGPQKSTVHQSGVVHVTSHRLFYIDAENELTRSFIVDLSSISQTEYYAGLFKSSPKVTLHLSSHSTVSGQAINIDVEPGFGSWECGVCAYRNPPGLSPAASRICGLCGVPRAAATQPAAQTLSTSLSSSLPSSYYSTPISNSDRLANACPACTFINHSTLRSCEICGTDLPQPTNVAERAYMKSAPSSRPHSPDSDDDSTYIMKISFRKGGDKTFYAALKRALKSKVWENKDQGNSVGVKTDSVTSTTVSREMNTAGRSGITGILRTVESNVQDRQSDMKDSLQDLEALMIKAKDMVRLAADLNERLTASTTSSTTSGPSSSTTTWDSTTTLNPSTEPEEATFIRSSLSQLGLQMANTPVTIDMMQDENKWINELALELGRVLQGTNSPTGTGGMMKRRGIIAYDEVWGGWNRARGVGAPHSALHIPSRGPPHSGTHDPPIRSRTFKSGLMVLHTPRYTHAAFSARLSGFLTMSGPKTTMEVAMEEDITLGLSKEMIEAVEMMACLANNGGMGELRWYANLFIGYLWDGQE
ncbi:hypothetical protein BD779DRAFT_1612113 [Infundibulicybe gibba]|nr:hypothetical protein BD779DRAFT_1612113 [Infundibulicybe gibba]